MINRQLYDLKDKFYDKSNIKNENLIHKEIESDDFQDYVYDEICKINKKTN